MRLEIKDGVIYKDGVRYIKEEIEEKSDAQKFLAGEAAVHCPRERDAERFLVFLEGAGFTWVNHKGLLNTTFWAVYGKDTCYVKTEDYKMVNYLSWQKTDRNINFIPFTVDFLKKLSEALKEEK